MFEDVAEFLGFGFDPEVHGVENDEAGFVHLFPDAELEFRGDVAEAEEPGGAVLGWYDGVEVGKDVELGVEGVAGVHVVVVASGPAEGFAAFDLLDAAGVDVVAVEEVEVVVGEVGADDADHVDGVGEVACREGNVGGGAAEGVGGAAEWGFDVVEGE